MRPLRLLPPLALGLGAAAVASQWDLVTSAYAEPAAPAAEVAFGGLDLAVELTPVEPSPFWFAPAPDTRDVPIGLAYEVAEADPAPPLLTGGTALLKGTVTGPEGPLPGVVVRIERHTRHGMAATDVGTDGLGRWKVDGLAGGRYRVRAWVPGVATMADSAVFFLEEGEPRSLTFTLEPVDPTPRLRFDHRGEIQVGGTGTVAVSVTTRSVDQDGFVVVSGVAGAVVTLEVSGPATVASSPATADGDGVARFVVACTGPGSASATITHQAQSLPVTLPLCVAPPPPPPDPTAPGAGAPSSTIPSAPLPSGAPTSTLPGATTTTRAPGGGGNG